MIGEVSGFKVEVEHLRIPSTRNVAHIGRTRTIDPKNPEEVARIAQQQLELLQKSGFVHFVPRFRDQSKHGEKKKRTKKQENPLWKIKVNIWEKEAIRTKNPDVFHSFGK